MDASRPLPTWLSQALVAFTVEFDNEFEHRMPNRTTRATAAGEARRGPWLTSQVMWANVMQHVDAGGVAVADLHVRARTARDSLAGLQRWGYVTVVDGVVRPTAAGRRAQDAWRGIAGAIEQRWRVRFGSDAVDRLRAALLRVRETLDVALPDYLPIVYPTQGGRAETPSVGSLRSDAPDLSVLLAQVLLAFTLDFEAESRLSLAISANPLRVLGSTAIPVRDLPRLTGVSKEANSMATGFLARVECAVVEPAPAGGRGSVIRLTEKGERAQAKYRRVLSATEAQWSTRFGTELVGALDAVVGDESRLREGMRPYPDGWRASVRPAVTLPHYPMVLHRGGYPDGS